MRKFILFITGITLFMGSHNAMAEILISKEEIYTAKERFHCQNPQPRYVNQLTEIDRNLHGDGPYMQKVTNMRKDLAVLEIYVLNHWSGSNVTLPPDDAVEKSVLLFLFNSFGFTDPTSITWPTVYDRIQPIKHQIDQITRLYTEMVTANTEWGQNAETRISPVLWEKRIRSNRTYIDSLYHFAASKDFCGRAYQFPPEFYPECFPRQEDLNLFRTEYPLESQKYKYFPVYFQNAPAENVAQIATLLEVTSERILKTLTELNNCIKNASNHEEAVAEAPTNPGEVTVFESSQSHGQTLIDGPAHDELLPPLSPTGDSVSGELVASPAD